MKQKLHIITIGVTDLDRAKKFYEEGLGWTPSDKSEEGITFYGTEGVVFALYPREKLAEDVGVLAETSGFSGVTLAHNVASEEEVDKVLAEAEKAGATIVKEAQKVFWGGYSGYFTDPDGHLWEVAYNPFTGFDERDQLQV